jgi:hypothetical protein
VLLCRSSHLTALNCMSTLKFCDTHYNIFITEPLAKLVVSTSRIASILPTSFHQIRARTTFQLSPTVVH